VTSSEIAEGQLVTKSLFTEAASLAKGISIPDGMIAVTVPTEAWQRAGGLIQKGSKVAVFDTFTVMDGKGNTPSGDGLSKQYERNQSTRLLLTGLEVLSVVDEKKAAEDGDVGKAIVTVAVKQADAEKLIHGQQTGTLYFALLGGKSEVAPGNGVDNRSLFGN
jgi:pilus assembly protein CpaB